MPRAKTSKSDRKKKVTVVKLGDLKPRTDPRGGVTALLGSNKGTKKG